MMPIYLVNICLWVDGTMEVYPTKQSASSQANAIKMAREELGMLTLGTPIVTTMHTGGER
jgi:hypothetical protein